jgi:2,5-dioxopentanoate dehydrogenase
MVFLPVDSAAQSFGKKLQELVSGAAEFRLLTPGIRSSYLSAIAGRKKQAAVKPVAEAANAGACAGLPIGAILFETDARSFLASSGLDGEIFGPTTLLVQDSSREQLLEIARGLEGHLTATILGTEQDLRERRDSGKQGRASRVQWFSHRS